MTEQQHSFINACLDPSATLAEVMRAQNVSALVLAGWLRSPRFCRYLRRLHNTLHTRRDLGLVLASQHAADTLEQLAAGELAKPAPQQRQACVDLIRLARAAPKKRAPATVKPSAVAEDVEDAEAAALIAQLRG